MVRIQIFDHKKYTSLAFSQQFQKQDIPTKRGVIFDRNGLKLAESVQVSSVFADPLVIRDKKKTAEAISQVLGLNKQKLKNYKQEKEVCMDKKKGTKRTRRCIKTAKS